MIAAVGILVAVNQFLHGDFAIARPEGVFQRPFEKAGPFAEKMRLRAPAPFGIVGLQVDDGFEHVQRRRIGGRVGAAGFAVDACHFRESHNQLVGLLENLPGFGDGDARVGGGHVEQIAFIQRRHELAAQPLERPDR